MYSFRNAAGALTLIVLAGTAAAQAVASYPGIGRAATPKEVVAWDIDVRPDFKGLPAGSGSVAQGQVIWESQCASCHGVFGESNEVFNPLIGGTTGEDVKTGRVANLMDPTGGRTILMKLATLSTLWDYINRAMPWTAPKSLKPDEVYAVTAFLLNLGGVVPQDFTLSNQNMAQTQARMPNRNGMQTRHNLWPGTEFGGTKQSDTRNVVCMKDCQTEVKVASFLPDFARDAHGNLAEQNRTVGAQRGADTSRPESSSAKSGAATAPVVSAKAAAVKPSEAAPGKMAAIALLGKNGCTACHSINNKIIGPSFADVAKKYPGKVDYLTLKIKSGGSGVWGTTPMPAQTLHDGDAAVIAAWLAAGADK